MKGYELASAALQGVLSTVDKSLIVDGKFGTFTEKSFKAASPAIQEAAAMVIKPFGYSIESLRAVYKKAADERDRASATTNRKLVSGDDAQAYIRRALSFDDRKRLTVDAMFYMLNKEAVKIVLNGVTYYDALSVAPSGKYCGLYQMGAAAWQTAQAALAGRLDLGKFIAGDKTSAWADPWLNTAAAVGNAMSLAAGLSAKGYRVTPATLYLAHNQGLGGALSYIKTGKLMYPGQSKELPQVLAAVRKDLSLPGTFTA